MNYANPPYPQNPPYPGYPPQNYARPKKKNELWFVLAGVFLILYVVVFELFQLASYAEDGRTLTEVFSGYSAESWVSLAGRVILLVFGAICMAFRRNHGVLVTFSGILAFTELCEMVGMIMNNGRYWYYPVWFVRSVLSILFWFFLAVLIVKNLRQMGRGTASFFIALCSIMVYVDVELEIYADYFGSSLSFGDFLPYTYWLAVLSYVNLFAAQMLLIFAAYMPNKVTFEPASTVAHAPMQPPMPPYAPNTQPQSSTPMNQAPYAPSPAQPIQPTPPTQPSVPSYQTDIAQTASVQPNAPVQSNAPIQPTAPVQPTSPVQPTAPTAEAVPVSPYADAPTVVVAPTAPAAPIPQAAPASPASPVRTVDVSAQLRSLQTLLEQGVITEGEYTARKNRLLGL